LDGETQSAHELVILSWKNRAQIEFEFPGGDVADNGRCPATQTRGERGRFISRKIECDRLDR
jgi:hypothetical protein